MTNNFPEPESPSQPDPESQPKPEPGSPSQSRYPERQTPSRRPPTPNPPEPQLDDLELTKALLDASIFITYHNHTQLIRQKIGDPKIFHTEITEREWRNQFIWHKTPSEYIKGKIAKGLAVFDSTYLPETPVVNAVADVIERCLREGGIEKLESRKLTDNDRRDIMTVAYGIVHGVDVVARDKLFFTIEKMFKKDITIYVDREKNSMRQAWRLVTRLEAKGVQTPASLSHLLRLNTSEDIKREIEEARRGDQTR